MTTLAALRRLALAGLLLAPAAIATPALAADRPAAEILKEIDGLKPPTLDRTKTSDQAYVKTYIASMQETAKKKADLIGELAKADPASDRLAKLLPERWVTLMQTEGADAATKEAEATLATTKDAGLKVEGRFALARASMMSETPDPAKVLAAIQAFAAEAPKDARVPQLLYSATMNVEDKATKIKLEDQILKDFPESRYVKSIEGARKQRSSVGKPFELEFTDAIHGSPVSIKGLKGKVVVIDFWATWCGPCIAEMPKMKKLYAEFKPQGVEFIGVSLDQPEKMGGLTKLKEYVAKNEIAWPQYYQGNYWQSDFSSSWGINSIPCVFLVDADGNLASVEARGKLETMIPELLKKATAKVTATTGD